MESNSNDPPGQYDALIDIVSNRRDHRKFEAGRQVPRETLERVLEAGRWGPSGANVQPWDFLMVDEPEMRDRVRDVMLAQQERQRQDAPHFPTVHKRYLENTAAILVVLGDRRWEICFPEAESPEAARAEEYLENKSNIFFCGLGAAVQNMQLAIHTVGLGSAWLSSGGEKRCADELRELLGFPEPLRAYAIVPIGYPAKKQEGRWRRPLDQVAHWNRYDMDKFRPDELVPYFKEHLRQYALYRDEWRMQDWPDYDERVGPWKKWLAGEDGGAG
jgi:nitroreductase